MRGWLWMSLLGLAASGCGGGGGSQDEAPNVNPSTVERTTHSGIRAAQAVAVRDAAQWQQLWTLHKGQLQPMPERPVLDFTRSEVLAVFVGDRPNGCYGVEITEVRDLPAERLVRYRLEEPRDGQPCTLAITQPTHLVAAPASRLPVRFEAFR